MTSREAYLVLNALPHVGPVTLRRLLERFPDPEQILAAPERELRQVQGVGPEIAGSIRGWQAHFDLEAEFKKLEKQSVRVVMAGDPEYPPLLKEIYDPPVILYVRGVLKPEHRFNLSVVGSRKTSYYGTETARKLSYQLAGLGLSVVSGLARGIDSAAHAGALQARGHTVAVLGSGVDVIYPPENARLYDAIVEGGGAIVSEFPLGANPTRQTFPMRNRVVSGMSLGTVVVEAGRESGAMITANFANEQGRQVFAVPGRVNDALSRGCHRLIKDGAKLVEDVDDILCEFENLFTISPRPSEPSEAVLEVPLTDEQKKIFDLLLDEETGIDQITARSGLAPAVVSAGLFMLEMKKLVKQLPGKKFVRRNACGN
jgi:DNA processing protein